MGQFVQQPEIDWGAPGVPSGWGWVDGISGGIQPAQPPGMSWIFFSLTCFLAAVKPGQACQKNDIVLEIHFPYLEMKPGAIYISEPHSSSEQFHPELSLWS